MVDSSAPPLVFVIDDDTRSARLLARLLREDGFAVEVHADGSEALLRLGRAPKPNLIVTDYRMPNADGLAVARYARAQIPEIPVFIITAYPELIDRTADASHAQVFTKPLSYQQPTEAPRAPNRLETRSE